MIKATARNSYEL